MEELGKEDLKKGIGGWRNPKRPEAKRSREHIQVDATNEDVNCCILILPRGIEVTGDSK